jgi:hypothetical protein
MVHMRRPMPGMLVLGWPMGSVLHGRMAFG